MTSPSKQGVVPTADFLNNIVKNDANSSAYALDIHNQSISQLSSLHELTKLRSLDCSFNLLQSLEGIHPLAANLKELISYSNKLDDIYCLGDCTNLNILHLHDNRISEIPNTFKKLIHLKEISLQRNKLTSLNNLSMNSNLTHIDASNNELNSESTTSLEQLVSLNYLFLNGNDFGPNLPGCLRKLSGLEELQVSDNQLTELKNLPR